MRGVAPLSPGSWLTCARYRLRAYHLRASLSAIHLAVFGYLFSCRSSMCAYRKYMQTVLALILDVSAMVLPAS